MVNVERDVIYVLILFVIRNFTCPSAKVYKETQENECEKNKSLLLLRRNNFRLNL